MVYTFLVNMDKFEKETREIISEISEVLGKEILSTSYRFEFLGVPHSAPKSLDDGKMAIYIFKYKDTYLKIGKVGAKSKARYTSQHYLPNSSISNLAKSILKDESFLNVHAITEKNVGEWIKDNCQRINILIDKELGHFALSLIEAMLHYKYQPKYEGLSIVC